MKRAIYVGRPKCGINYGITGKADQVTDKLTQFIPDGGTFYVMCKHAQIYIPSEDQTRHCPKP